MKTPEELKMLKAEIEVLNGKLSELSEEELEQISGGLVFSDSELDSEIDPAEFEEFADRMREQLGKEIFESKDVGNFIFYRAYISQQNLKQEADDSNF